MYAQNTATYSNAYIWHTLNTVQVDLIITNINEQNRLCYSRLTRACSIMNRQVKTHLVFHIVECTVAILYHNMPH